MVVLTVQARRLYLVSSIVVAHALGVGGPVAAGAQDSSANGSAKLASRGAYTESQARRGEGAYKSFCLSCHSAKEYTGEAFKVKWLSRTAFDLFETIRTLMPEDNPGILPAQDYVDIVAYILSLNGFPPGAEELAPDEQALRKVLIDSLPTGMLSRALHGYWSAVQARTYHGARASTPGARVLPAGGGQ
jgi:hypothetical protein